MRRVSLAVALLASAGCSKLLGIEGVTRGDGGNGSGAVDASIDAPPNTVIGRQYTRYLLPTPADVPRDLSTATVQAWIPDAAQPTGYRVVFGTGNADGTFSISPVPDGIEYVLKINGTYYLTTAHVIDIHSEPGLRGSPPPVPATGMAFYDFNLTNLTPVVFGPEQVFDNFEIDSFSLGVTGNNFSTPPNNSTTFVTTYDWHLGVGIFTGVTGMPDPAQGDDVWVLHYRPQTLLSTIKRAHATTQLRSALQLTNVGLTPGGHVAQSGAMTPVNLTNNLQLSVVRANFDAGYDAFSSIGGLATGGLDVSLYAYPAPTDNGLGGLLLDVPFDDWTRSSSLSENFTTSYGDPFSAGYSRIMTVVYNRSRWILLPGTTSPRPSNSFGMIRSFAYTGGNPSLTPGLLPPGNLKIAGQAAGAGGKVAFDGVAPVTVSWNGVSAAKMYQVFVVRVFANGTQTRTSIAGLFVTTKTSVDLPAEMFNGSEFFAINVGAYQTPGDPANGLFRFDGIPYQISMAPSGMFRFTSTCGNGAVDGTEQCDTNGESATCDVDCTTRSCGDGLRNVAAGEACDTIKDTSGCDSDCTVPVCGDGHVNLMAGEDCDDGNQVADNNGCSAQCKLVNVCGNGIVEALGGETCDPGTVGGQTTACDSDCTTAVCGDGHLNTVRGEICDDGNTDDTDGCKSNCMP